MFCINCGTDLTEEASFCWKCGKSQRGDITNEEPRWETCRILVVLLKDRFLRADWRFWAEAIGPKGRYNAGYTSVFSANNPLSRVGGKQAADALIKLLVEDGWEPTGVGDDHWYSYTFRRRVK